MTYTSPFKKEPKLEDDPAYKWGFQQGEKILDFMLGLAILPLFVWGAWNLCMPALFGLPAIGYVKSVALYILTRFIVR
tara:strand:- start:5448 stop:5681 length:234 start_codon:yes stop_codon:yes gene_type:complete